MKSIHAKILICFFIITLIPVTILGMFSYKTSTKALNKKISNSELYSLEQVSKNIDKKLDIIEKFLDMVIISKEFQVDLSKKYGEFWEINNNLDKFISNYFYKDASNINVYFFGIRDGVYSYRTDYILDEAVFQNYDWFLETKELNGKINWVGTIENPVEYSDIKRVYVAGRLLKNNSEVIEDKNIGTIFIALNEDFIEDVYENINVENTGIMMMIDKSGKIISCSDKNLDIQSINSCGFANTVFNNDYGYVKSTFDNKSSMIIYYTSLNSDYKIVKIMPYNNFIKEISDIKVMTLIICLVCIVFLFVISFLLSKSIVSPIIDLKDAMNEVKKGNFNISLAENRSDEVGQMINSYNFMIKELKQLFKKVVSEEKIKKQIEIKSLQYQINPHFIYNVLGSIKIQAELDGSKKTAKMIQSLSRLLNRTIGKAGTMIKIFDEIENINDFLYIQQVLHDGKIVIENEIEKEILDYMIPNLLLQPLVENSVFHGKSKKNNGILKIRIMGEKVLDKVIIKIYDDGIGMEKLHKEKILERCDDNKRDRFSSVGIKNVSDRIKLTFGDEYGLNIDSEYEKWTLITVILPVIKERNINEHIIS